MDVEETIKFILESQARAEARADRADARMDRAEARMDKSEKKAERESEAFGSERPVHAARSLSSCLAITSR